MDMKAAISSSKLMLDEKRSGGEKVFFSSYGWCLNPILTFKDLLTRLEEEVERFDGTGPNWQQDESKVNIYLFSCAIACTLADYLSKQPWHLTPLAKSYPRVRRLILEAESVLNYPSEVKAFLKYRKLREWGREWDDIVESACRFLILPGESSQSSGVVSVKKCVMEGLKKFRSMSVPVDLLIARMKLNEGFRCQDLTHHDVITLADRFLLTDSDKKSKYVIIGSRTAGSYLSPLLKIYLEQHGFVDVDWIALRPKFGMTKMERWQLRRLLIRGANAILIDDYSNTGHTLRMLERIARSFGVPAEKIVILTPIHPVVVSRNADSHKTNGGTKPEDLLSSSKETKVIAIHHADLYITKIMEPQSVEGVLKGFLSGNDVESISIHENPEVECINKELWSHYPDSFQVRLKRVYEITIHKKNGSVEMKRVFAKSVGLGWLGYHAYMVGEMMSEFVPKIIGLHSGVLFMEWVDGQTLSNKTISDVFLNRISSYLAHRTKNLVLNEDPRSTRLYLGWGWLEILSILRRVYNNLLGYLKYDYLLNLLKQALHSKSVLVDGRMRPDEWILYHAKGPNDESDSGVRGDRLLKVDFEHHNFGAPELDVVDPAYDIAITSFEFQLTDGEEEKIISRYAIESGDKNTLSERVVLYKLLYATAVEGRTDHQIMGLKKKDTFSELVRRFQWSLDFRTFTMNKFCASLLKKYDVDAARPGIFFTDIDGVFDVEVLGFPHTTMSGLEALSLLRSKGYSVVLNTGRSCLHVRNYCANYCFDGGIGEYGSVIVDMVHDKEIPLINGEVVDEISRCRKIFENLDGIFVDSGYHYAVRVFRYTAQGTRGLDKDEANKLLREYDFKKLRVITRDADTYFVGKNANKGEAIEQYKNHIGYSGDSIIAIGDSDEDIAMLENATLAFAPRNCSDGIHKISKRGKCAIVSRPAQRGLLQVAKKLVTLETGGSLQRSDKVRANGMVSNYINSYDENSFQHIMVRLLTIAEYPLYRRIIYLFT